MKQRSTSLLIAAAGAASLAVILTANASRPVPPAPAALKPPRSAQVARGKYLVTIGGCNDCHTPWVMQPNGKPGPDTGTGIWTFDIFRNTIRNGRHWGVGRPLNPPMPWFNYREMTDDDLAAVFAYIHTLKPIHNEVQQPLPPSHTDRQ